MKKSIASMLISFSLISVLFLSFFAISHNNEDLKYAPVLAANNKPVMIIDPGHGGEDGGAVSITGTAESSINLQISQRIYHIVAFLGYDTVMTRETENIDYPDDAATTRARKTADQRLRVEMINSFDNAFLISIHQNKYPSEKPHGAQIFYTEKGKTLSDRIYLSLKNALSNTNIRSNCRISDDIYLMRKAKCPAVLIECGFLSNNEEAHLLEQEDYQTKLAILIAGGYNDYIVNDITSIAEGT